MLRWFEGACVLRDCVRGVPGVTEYIGLVRYSVLVLKKVHCDIDRSFEDHCDGDNIPFGWM